MNCYTHLLQFPNFFHYSSTMINDQDKNTLNKKNIRVYVQKNTLVILVRDQTCTW